MKTLRSDEWGNIWVQGNSASNDIAQAVAAESRSVRCRKILAYLRGIFGDLSGISTIEIGSGSGIYSLILAGLGAKITLVDYSAEVLTLAEQNLKALGLDGTLVQGDAFRLPSGLGGFDVAMSFGTVEHYRYPARLDICRAHVDLVRPGGATVISTPNLYFLPHEVLKVALRLKGKWFLGYEGSFSRSEMSRMATRLDLVNPQIVGSSFPDGVKRYVNIVRGTSTFRRLFGGANATIAVAPDREAQRDHWFDDYFGQDVVLMGMRAAA